MFEIIVIYAVMAVLVFLNGKFAYDAARNYQPARKRYVFKRWKDRK